MPDRDAYLGDVGIAETTAYLCRATPIFDLRLHFRIAPFDDTRNYGVALAVTFQIGHHLAHGSAGIPFAQPCRDIRVVVTSAFSFWIFTSTTGTSRSFTAGSIL